MALNPKDSLQTEVSEISILPDEGTDRAAEDSTSRPKTGELVNTRAQSPAVDMEAVASRLCSTSEPMVNVPEAPQGSCHQTSSSLLAAGATGEETLATEANNRATAARKRFSVNRSAGQVVSRMNSTEFEEVSDSSLQQAALLGNLELVTQLISDGTSVNAPVQCHDAEGGKFATLLHVLSSRPGLQNGKEVLSEVVKGANVNGRSSSGATPLIRACLHKHVAAVELLLGYGADVKPRDDKGFDAVTCCVMPAANSVPMDSEPQELSAEILVLLAEKGADVDQIANTENAPLLKAIASQNQSAVVALTELGATARFLHKAVEDASTSIITHLLQAQANPFEEDAEGQTVLDVAFRRGDEEIITLLRNHIGDLERSGANPGGMGGERSARTSVSTEHLEQPASPDAMVKSLSRNSGASQTSIESEADNGGLGLTSSRFRVSLRATPSKESSRRLSLRRISKTIGDHHVLWGGSSGREGKLRRDSAFTREFKKQWKHAQEACLKVNNNRWFQAVMFCALITVLFLPDLWVLCDIEGNEALDAILILVIILFVTEIFVQTVGMPSVYVNSFFFWMDLVGACSVPLDHSAVSDNLPRNFDNAVVMRAARMARLGARAGRFTKLLKLLRFLPGVHASSHSISAGAAKTMSNALVQSLSTRVSCLIIVMVMFLPLFDLATYPENDFSMKTWMNALDYAMVSSLEGRTPYDIDQKIADFHNFYSNKDYYPFKVSLQQPNGTIVNTRLKALAPRRENNEITIRADSGSVSAVFNFGAKNRIDALCNMMLIMTIIFLMMGFSLLLSNSVSAIVLVPLENLLSGVKTMASKIFKSVTSITKNVGDAADGDKPHEVLFGNETDLLEKVIDKLAALNAITMKTNPMDAETLEQLGENERAVLQGFQRPGQPMPDRQLSPSDTGKPKKSREGKEDGDSSSSSDEESANTVANTETLVFTLERHLEEAQLDWADVDNMVFNVYDIDDKQRHLVSLCFLIFHLGLQYNGDKHQVLASFTKAAAAGYNSSVVVPYHNWVHAVDVTHAVFRLLNVCATERFLSSLERYALVVSALCHDIGHPGFNNPYLVETSHELAIRYNDRSPLENMHCAKLFELVNTPKTAVFAQFSRNEFREIRQVCIEAILHTDNTHHFAMVKELQMLYEMNSDVFDISLQMYQSSKIEFPPREIVDIYNEPEKKKLMRNLCLHFSDISNPTKPFLIAKQWAWAIVDEFFLQGDKEKELGIVVQPLNDRLKVSRPYSQVGFIEFFVAPCAFATVRLLPPLMPCTDQMISNLQTWCEEWVKDTVPKPEPEEQAKLQDRVTKLEAKYVFRGEGTF